MQSGLGITFHQSNNQTTFYRNNEPADNNLVETNKPLRLSGVIDERAMKELSMRLNQLISLHRRAKEKEEGKTGVEQSVSRYVWTTSNIVLMFLEPTIKKCTKKPIYSEDPTDEGEVPIQWQPA